MNKKAILQLLFLPLFFAACTTSSKNTNVEAPKSFLPMQIGNYWKNDPQNYTEILDTVKINGETYYKFYSLVGGDAISISYLRIDKENQLWESSPSEPNFKYLKARFNGKVNDTFFTLNDKSVNDNKVTIIEKTDKKMTFSYDMVHHPNLKGQPNAVSYIKGQGFEGNWKGLKINGVIIK